MELLLANGIAAREVASNFLVPATIWVEEDDYEKALEIASSVGARHAKQARSEWEREWRERYKGSYIRWIAEKARRPRNLFKLLLLALMVGVFVIYPIMYAFRRLIAS